MPIQEDATNGPPVLATSREPKVAKTLAGVKGSLGMIALNDAMILVLAAWAVLFLLYFSLRTYNI